MGVSAGDVVVRLGGVEAGTDDVFEAADSGDGGGGQAGSDLLAGLGESVERSERVADHGLEVERTCWLVQCPERLGAVRIEIRQLAGMRLWELPRRHEGLIESPEKGERVEPRLLETGAKLRRDERRAPRRHGSRMV
jgi:hypothetical protein